MKKLQKSINVIVAGCILTTKGCTYCRYLIIRGRYDNDNHCWHKHKTLDNDKCSTLTRSLCKHATTHTEHFHFSKG